MKMLEDTFRVVVIMRTDISLPGPVVSCNLGHHVNHVATLMRSTNQKVSLAPSWIVYGRKNMFLPGILPVSGFVSTAAPVT
ncbi:hypothetical protein BH18ACI4_BH18ACI4_26210 [soil metagenome]